MTGPIHIPQDELALFAMRALSPEEATPVRLHVEGCAECRAALAEAVGGLSLLAMSVDQHPVPEGARQRFLDRIAADKDAVRDASRPAAAAPEMKPAEVIPIAKTRPIARKARWSVFVAWGSVAALLLLCAGLELHVRSLNLQLQQQAELMQAQSAVNARARAVLNLLTAPGAQHVMLTAAKARPAPSARAVYLPSQGALMMQASNLEPLPANKTYELWIIPTKGAPMPAGMFRPDAAGNASVVMPEMPRGVEAKALGVTIENAGGSATPTMPIVLQGAPAAGE